MLKTIVEDGDRRADRALGDGARDGAHVTDEHRRARHRARQHQRLVAAAIEIGGDVAAVADDDDAVLRTASSVAAAENRRPLAGVEEQPRQVADDRRLAAPAHGEVADGKARGQTLFPQKTAVWCQRSARFGADLWHQNSVFCGKRV
jgi:hypothetical protein